MSNTNQENNTNNPYALYYNGDLVGIITNPNAYPGGIYELCDAISPSEGLADAKSMHSTKELVEVLRPLPKTIPLED